MQSGSDLSAPLSSQAELTAGQKQQLDGLNKLVNCYVSKERLRALVLQNRTDEQIAAITSVDMIKGVNKDWRNLLGRLQVGALGLSVFGVYALVVAQAAKENLTSALSEYDSPMPRPNGYTSYIQDDYCEAWSDYYDPSTCNEITEKTQERLLYLMLGIFSLFSGITSLYMLGANPSFYQAGEKKSGQTPASESSDARDGSRENIGEAGEKAIDSAQLTDFAHMASDSNPVTSLDYQNDIVKDWNTASLRTSVELIFIDIWPIFVTLASIAYFSVIGANTKDNTYSIFEGLCVLPYLLNNASNSTQLSAAWSECDSGVYNTTGFASEPPTSIDGYCDDLCEIRTRQWTQLPREVVRDSSICFWVAAAPPALCLAAVVFAAYGRQGSAVGEMFVNKLVGRSKNSSIVEAKAASFIGNFDRKVLEEASSNEKQQQLDDSVVKALESMRPGA